MTSKKSSAARSGLVPGRKDKQSITSSWQLLQPLIASVTIREVHQPPRNAAT